MMVKSTNGWIVVTNLGTVKHSVYTIALLLGTYIDKLYKLIYLYVSIFVVKINLYQSYLSGVLPEIG